MPCPGSLARDKLDCVCHAAHAAAVIAGILLPFNGHAHIIDSNRPRLRSCEPRRRGVGGVQARRGDLLETREEHVVHVRRHAASAVRRPRVRQLGPAGALARAR